MFRLLFGVVAVYSLLGLSVSGQDLEIEPLTAKLKVGTTTTVKISSTAEVGKITWTGNLELFEPIAVVESSANEVLVALKPKLAGTGFISFSSSTISGVKKLEFTVEPRLSLSNLEFSSSLDRESPPISVLQDGTLKIQVRRLDGERIPDDLISAVVEPSSALRANFQNGQLTLFGDLPTPDATVRLLSDNVELTSFQVQVKEAVGQIVTPSDSTVSLPQGGTARSLESLGISFRGKQDSVLSTGAASASCTVDRPSIATVDADCSRITPGSTADDAYLTIKAGGKEKVVRVRVTQIPTTIAISSEFGSKLELSYPNKTLKLNASVLDTTSRTIDTNPPLVKWYIPDASDVEFVRLNQTAVGNRVEVVANKMITGANDESVKIRGCLPSVDASLASAASVPTGCSEVIALVRRPYAVNGFQPLKIRLDMLDRQTAQDLFGKRAAEEYFIAKVRLFNEIGRQDEDFGNSILVYSESLEVKVAVEYRYHGDTKQEWQTLTEDVARQWFNLPITNGSYSEEESKSKKCKVIQQPHMFVPYRPLTFEMVLNTQDRRDSRSKRSRVLKTLNGVSSLASFVTSIAVPGAGSDLPLGLEKFRNLLIPSFEKLFPSLNEVQRQNITSMVMRPLEEIPFGSDITRVIFFPRRSIDGVLLNQPNARRTDLRIGAISISDACAEAGIIKKAQEAPSQQINQ